MVMSWLMLAVLSSACAVHPKGHFTLDEAPTPPNYSRAACWAALPFTVDNADRAPGELKDNQKEAAVDVFFLHPTTYTGKRGQNGWNAPVYDRQLNQRTDESTILYQASIFNGAGRVFAPRYRQAHLFSYFTENQQFSAQQAFELAYQDVKAAFDYYLRNYNNGRPIIIAAHSQGTTHAKRLLREYFDGTSLQRQLVAAYLVGIPVEENYFRFIKVCGGPEETGCFCSWRTWRRGAHPRGYRADNEIAVTNPLIWTTTDAYAARAQNEGAVVFNFEKIIPRAADARVHDGLLWTGRPRFPGSFLLLLKKNYHIGDYNLFYVNVRQNAIDRVNAFQRNNTKADGK